MILDFNFQVKDLAGRPAGLAKDTILEILQRATRQREKDNYLDKIELWCPKIAKAGAIEVDEVDAKEIVNDVLACSFTFRFAKIAIKNYIEKRISDSKPDKGGKKNKQHGE